MHATFQEVRYYPPTQIALLFPAAKALGRKIAFQYYALVQFALKDAHVCATKIEDAGLSVAK